MATFLPGPVVADIRGSSGGVVFSKNASGSYIRNRTKPINPNTARQTAARAIFAFVAEQWREGPMTEADRIAWGVYAASFANPNLVGTPVSNSGFNAFVGSNSAIVRNGSSIVTAGPITLGLPAVDPIATVTLSEASGVSVIFDDTFEWVDEDDGYLSIELGQPQSASRNFFAGPYRWALNVAGDSGTPETSPIAAAPNTTWTLIEGQRVWVRFRIIRADGRVTNLFGAQPIDVGA